MDKLAKVIADFMTCYQSARIYTPGHPKFIESINTFMTGIDELLINDISVSFGFVGSEITSGDKIFFELTKKAGSFIEALAKKNIEKITIRRGLTRAEVESFVGYLVDNDGPVLEPQDFVNKGIENIVSGEFLEGGDAKKNVAAEDLYVKSKKIIDSFSKMAQMMLKGEDINPSGLSLFMGSMQKDFHKYMDLFRVSVVKRYDVNTFYHSVNVAVLAMAFSRRLGYSPKDVNEIGVAALFHDLGKIYISENIINKEGELTDSEFMQIKSHTVLGAQMLLKYSDTLGILPVVVAFQHHKGYDGMRYPKTQFLRAVNEIALIVSLCDVYDALSQRRSYKLNYSPERVYSIIEQQKGKLIKPELFDKFFDFFGVWPNGTIVRLNSGIVGVVDSQNQGYRFAPCVNIFETVSLTGKIINLHEEENLRIERSLNPIGEGRMYLDVLMKS
ncbi:MAG: HD domain-containing protein [Candidatus Omnitrophica bacterium]|nr:HD domain-containing protein [Candidatus Omnitrophota bacterium]